MNGLYFRLRWPRGQQGTHQQRRHQVACAAPERQSLHILERVVAAARLGDAALLRAARHGCTDDLQCG